MPPIFAENLNLTIFGEILEQSQTIVTFFEIFGIFLEIFLSNFETLSQKIPYKCHLFFTKNVNLKKFEFLRKFLEKFRKIYIYF